MTVTITCVCGCGRTGEHWARGLLSPCYKRASRAHRLDDYPPRPMTQAKAAAIRRANAARRAGRTRRLEDYVFLRESGETRAAARQRLAVTDRTITRWHRTLRAQGRTDRWLYDPIPLNVRTRMKETTAA